MDSFREKGRRLSTVLTGLASLVNFYFGYQGWTFDGCYNSPSEVSAINGTRDSGDLLIVVAIIMACLFVINVARLNPDKIKFNHWYLNPRLHDGIAIVAILLGLSSGFFISWEVSCNPVF